MEIFLLPGFGVFLQSSVRCFHMQPTANIGLLSLTIAKKTGTEIS